MHGERRIAIEHTRSAERISAAFSTASSSTSRRGIAPWIRHEGEELFYILEGAITVETEDESTVLEAGSSIHFKSTRRHSSWNHGTSPAVILHVCTSDLFGDQNKRPQAADDARPSQAAETENCDKGEP